MIFENEIVPRYLSKSHVTTMIDQLQNNNIISDLYLHIIPIADVCDIQLKVRLHLACDNGDGACDCNGESHYKITNDERKRIIKVLRYNNKVKVSES